MIETVSNNSISILIRVINDISKPSEILIPKLTNYCEEVILIFSGTEEKYLDISKRYQQIEKIKILWVYSIGYSEPLLNLIIKNISSSWVMFLTDREVISSSLIDSLPELVNTSADAYCIYRVLEKYEDLVIPKSLLFITQEGRMKMFTCRLSRKEITRYNEIIHRDIKIKGKRIRLDPFSYSINRLYDVEDIRNSKDFIIHWLEKIKRYMFIEMFETRMKRGDLLTLIMKKMGTSNDYRSIFQSKAVFSRELTHYEYALYFLIRNFFNGKLGLNFTDKARINAIKGTIEHSKLLFDVSQYLQSLEEREMNVLEFIGMKSIFVCKEDQVFSDLIRPENSERNFIRHILKNFIELNDEYRDIDIDNVIEQVQTLIDYNIRSLLQL